MIELFKMAITKPLNAIVVALCIVVGSNTLGLFEVKTAVALTADRQIPLSALPAKIDALNGTVIQLNTSVNNLIISFPSEIDYQILKFHNENQDNAYTKYSLQQRDNSN